MTTETQNSRLVPCPFVYAKGKRCTGHVVSVEAFNANLTWSFDNGLGLALPSRSRAPHEK